MSIRVQQVEVAAAARCTIICQPRSVCCVTVSTTTTSAAKPAAKAQEAQEPTMGERIAAKATGKMETKCPALKAVAAVVKAVANKIG